MADIVCPGINILVRGVLLAAGVPVAKVPIPECWGGKAGALVIEKHGSSRHPGYRACCERSGGKGPDRDLYWLRTHHAVIPVGCAEVDQVYTCSRICVHRVL